MIVPGENHRDPWFAPFFKDVLAQMKYLFQTQEGTPIIYPGACDAAQTWLVSLHAKCLYFTSDLAGIPEVFSNKWTLFVDSFPLVWRFRVTVLDLIYGLSRERKSHRIRGITFQCADMPLSRYISLGHA